MDLQHNSFRADRGVGRTSLENTDRQMGVGGRSIVVCVWSNSDWESLVQLLWSGCAEMRGMPCTYFWAFTVPLIRTLAYSVAAFLSLRFSDGRPAEFHPALSHFFSAMFLTGLPKIDKERSVVEETSSTSPNDPDQKQRMHGN
jgi:hypothetical protein